jgi:NAD(P)H-dependent FMN reductase
MKLKIVLGSVRKGRLGERVAKWVTSELDKNKVEYELLDLLDYKMPFVDAEKVPFELNKKYPHEAVQRWSNKIDEGTAYIFITPEYNRGCPASLKNAIDWLGMELWSKPVAFVAYSDGPIGGARCVEHLRSVVSNFNMYDIRNSVLIGKADQVISTAGKSNIPALDEQIAKIATELSKLSDAL